MLFFNKPPFGSKRDDNQDFTGHVFREEAEGTGKDGCADLFPPVPPQRRVSTPATEARASIEESLSLDGPPDAYVTVAGRTYQYHGGSGYFGLQAHPEVLAATCEATLRYGLGTATSRAAFTSPPVFEVERRIAEIFGTSRAFYTSSGYMGNQILLDALFGTFDRVFIDESSHHSLFDAVRNIRQTRVRPIPFRHRDLDDLKEKLDGNLQWHERPLVLTDGLFSTLGTLAPIDRYLEILAHYEGASLLVDDAHGIGVLGKNGRGTLEHFGIDPATANRTRLDATEAGDISSALFAEPVPDGLADFAGASGTGGAAGGDPVNTTEGVDLYVGFTMSKAVGGHGGVIPGSDAFIERLMERSRVFSGASAPPSPIAAATAKGLAVLFEDALLRDRLRQNTRYLKSRLAEEGFVIGEPTVPISVLTLGSALNMRRIQKELSRRGILISYVPRHPGLGSEGALRLAVFSTHTPEQIDLLVDALADVAC